MNERTIARLAAFVLAAGVSVAACGVRGQAYAPAGGAGQPAAQVTSAGETSGGATSANQAPNAYAPDISAELQAVDGLLQDVNNAVDNGDAATNAGE